MVIRKRITLATLTIFALCTFSAEPSAGEAPRQPKNIELPQESVFRKVFENGLTILVKDIPSQGLVSIDVKIRCGSSTEEEYLGSGISHFVEHMVFKGTRRMRPGDIEREMRSYGGFLNGSASHDLTDFHVTVPSKYLANTLSVLKDMLLNASFEKSEFDREKEVILKEMNLYKDEPRDELLRRLYEAAYMSHPYKYPVIGYEDKLKSLKREDLIRYYERMYVPNRIVIAIVGDIEKGEAAAAVEKEFKEFRPADYREALQSVEPVQIGRRTLEKASPINLSYMAIGFHSTSILDRDLFAMDVLSMILGAGDDSRLNNVLYKQKKLVYSIASWNYTGKAPGLFVITAILDKSKFDITENGIRDEIDMVKNGSIDDEELERAKRMVIADYIFSRETIEAESGDICASEALTGNYDYSARYVEGVQSVSREEIKRAASIYLTEDNLTLIRLFPAYAKEPGRAGRVKYAKEKDVIRKEALPNGLTLLVREERKVPTVSLSAAFLGGLLVEDKNNNGISNLTARMLLKGAAGRDESQIRGAIERVGGKIDTFSGFSSFGINMTFLKDDLELALSVLYDVLTNSTFPQGELDREKALISAMIKDEEDDIFEAGSMALRKELFGDHPYGLRYIGEESSIESLKRDELINFYKTYCVPNNMVLSVSGDVDTASLAKSLTGLFAVMKRKEIPPAANKRPTIGKIKSREFVMDKRESLVLMGFLAIDIKDPDRYAFEVLSAILSGHSGRLFRELRDRLSLAYTLGCVQKLGIDGGYLTLYVATTKGKIEKTREALAEIVKDMGKRMVTDDELALAKRELVTAHKIKMQTNDFFSFGSALDELYGLGYDNIYKYEDRIENVTKEDIKRIADKYLDPSAYAEVVIAPK